MPLAIHRFMHSEARLSQDQLDTLREWATSAGDAEPVLSER